MASVLSILPYWYFWKFLNEFIVNKNVENTKYYALIIVGLMISYSFVYMAAVWGSHLLGFRLETNLRKAGIENLMEASFTFYDENPSGKIRRIIDDNAAETHAIVAHLIPDNAAVIITPIILLLITFKVDIYLGLWMVLVIVLSAFTVSKMTGNKEFMKLYNDSLERLNSESVEYVRGMQVVKIFKGTVYSFKAFYDAIVDYSKYVLDYTFFCRRYFILFQLILNLFVIFVAPFGIVLLNKGSVDSIVIAKIRYYGVVSGILFISFTKVMYVGMNSFLGVQAVDKLENLFEDMKKNKLDHGNIGIMDSHNIEFREVSFKYSEYYMLRDLSFKLDENKTYALVGGSGSGKSTIAKLI